MNRNKLIRILCISLVAVALALALILGVAVIGGAVAEGGIPEESEETPHFSPFFPEGSLDIGDILDSIDPGDFTRDPDHTRPLDPDVPDVTLPEWESDFEWPTLPPTLQTDPDFEWPTLPEGWDTLPEEWGTLPPEWGDLPFEPEDLADLLAGMDGGLDMPPGALAAGVASQLTVMDIYAENTDTLYLKMQSFGDYNGRGWDEAGMYGEAINDLGYSANYLPHYLMNEVTSFSGYPITITPKMEVRVIPYYIVASPELAQIQMSDVKAMGAYDEIYTLYYRPYATHVHAPLAKRSLSSYYAAYTEYVERCYLSIDETTLAYMKLIIEEQGFDKNDPDIIQKVATYIQNAATYNLAYNQNLDREPNVALAFLGAYKEGVCRHYATAATLLYRALGIPARYTVGFMADVTAWETTAVKGADAHAWVEVYEKGFGWRYVEVTGSPASGEPSYPPETGTGTGTAPGTGGDVTEPPTEPIHDPTTWGDLMAGTKGEMIPLSNIPLSTWNSIVFRVTAPYSDRLLLKLKSFGDYYTEDGFATVTDQPPAIYGYSAAYLTGLYLLSEGSVREQTLTISSPMNTVAAPYYITPSLTPGGAVNVGDTRVTGTVGKNEILTIPYCNATPGYASVDNPLLHAEYAAYAKQTFTTILWDHANSLSDLIAARGWQELSTAEAIPAVVTYLQTNYSLDPDTPATQTGDEVMYFLMQSCKGSHRHFAAAATVIYRMLGIPARYTVGYLAETVAGQETLVRGTDAYAWVEVYIEGIGWVAVDVAENASEIPEITLKPTDQFFLYDGSTHVHDGTLTGFEAYEALGYTYEATVSGERGACGATSASIVSVILYDPSGQDVTDRFAITCRQGTVTVYLAELTIGSDSQTKTYDGRPLTTVNVSILTGNLPAGYYCGITCTGSQTTVGTGYAAFDIQIWYHDGTGAPEDRTHYFIIRKQYGTLTVTPAPLILKADDAEKVYDGTPLTADGISVIGGALVGVDSIDSYTLEGSQTRVGRSENIITDIVIRNQYGDDVTACYAIETVAGILRVTAP